MKVLVYKEKRLLKIVDEKRVLREYRVSLGANPIGPKEQFGDLKTPEGIYQLVENVGGNKHPKGYLITYPTDEQKEKAILAGIDPGGDILVHGFSEFSPDKSKNHWKLDWTQGCIAITDEELDEMRTIVPFGTTIEIYL